MCKAHLRVLCNTPSHDSYSDIYSLHTDDNDNSWMVAWPYETLWGPVGWLRSPRLHPAERSWPGPAKGARHTAPPCAVWASCPHRPALTPSSPDVVCGARSDSSSPLMHGPCNSQWPALLSSPSDRLFWKTGVSLLFFWSYSHQEHEVTYRGGKRHERRLAGQR